MVNKDTLVSQVAQLTGYTKGDVRNVIEAIFDTIINDVAKDEVVNIVGFGKFEANKRAERNGVDPRTGEQIKIAAVTVPKFKAGSVFKEALK